MALAINKWLVILHAAKSLSSAQFGVLAATLSIAEILRIVADSGTESIIYSRARAESRPMPVFVRACFQLRTSTSFIVSALAVLFFSFYAKQWSALPLLMLIVPLSLQSSAVALLQRSGSPQKFLALALFAFGVCGFSAAYLLFGNSDSQLVHSLLILMPEVLVAACAVYLVKSRLPALYVGWRQFSSGIRAVYGLLWRSGLGAAIVIAYSRLDVVIVKPLLGTQLQADYSAGFRLVEPSAVLLGFAATALLSELGTQGGLDLKRKISSLLRGIKLSKVYYAVALSLLISVFIYLTAYYVLGLNKTSASVSLLLALIMPVRAVSGIVSAVQIRFGQMGSVLIATIINLSVTLTISLAAAQYFGVYAICVAALIGELSSISYQVFNLSRLWKSSAVNMTAN